MSNDILKQFFNSENQFDFEAYKNHAIEALKSGKPLMGADGIATPLIKNIIEASLEAEAEAHITETKSEANRGATANPTKLFSQQQVALS